MNFILRRNTTDKEMLDIVQSNRNKEILYAVVHEDFISGSDELSEALKEEDGEIEVQLTLRP